MEEFATVSISIKERFPNLPEIRINRLAKLIVASCKDYDHALEVAQQIPARYFGSFRFDSKTCLWVLFYNSFGESVDH